MATSNKFVDALNRIIREPETITHKYCECTTNASRAEFLKKVKQPEIAMAIAKGETITLTKERVFKYETTTKDETGKESTKVDNAYLTKAIADAMTANFQQAMIFMSYIDQTTGLPKADAPKELRLSYKRPYKWDDVKDCNIDVIQWCANKFGALDSLTYVEETGKGPKLLEFLKEHGFNAECLTTEK